MIPASIVKDTRDYLPLHAEKQKVSHAALSVVSIADFKVQGGAEVAEGVGSGLVWDRWPSAASSLLSCSTELIYKRLNLKAWNI